MAIMEAMKITFFLVFITGSRLVNSKYISLSGDMIPVDYDDYPPFIIPTVSYDWEEPVKSPKVCETEDCKRVAREFIGAMNKSVDPCVDFYEFSCGRWNEANPRVPSAVVDNQYEIAHNIFYQRLREIFEKEANTSDILPVRQGMKWYHACMDTEKLNANGIEPIKSILLQLGGWPISMEENEWSVDDYPWQSIESYYARLMGSNVFYDLKVEKRPEQSTFGSIVLTPPELIEQIRRPFFYDAKLYTAFVTKIVKMFVKNNEAVVSDTLLEKQIEDLIRFEKNTLKLITEKSNDAVKWPANPMSFEKFVNWYDTRMETENPTSKTAIDWETGIKQLFRPLNINIDRSDPIYVWNEKYFSRIGSLLERTPARTIVNYVHWNFIITMLKHTTEEMRDEIFEFTTYHSGNTERSPRWLECVQDTKMEYVAVYAFAKEYFPPSTRSFAQTVLRNIQRGLEANVDNSDWLDETSKLLIKEKIENIGIFIGYPDWYTNGTAVTNYHKGLTIGTQYFDNVLSYMRFKSKRKLMAPVISGDNEYTWTDPTSMDAVYLFHYNSLELTPAYFQVPLFSPELPDGINYGLVGSIAGHEMGHSVDTSGIRWRGYDKGSVQKYIPIFLPMGLSQETMVGYYKRVRCFVNQYDKYFGETMATKDEGVPLKYDDMGDSMGSSSRNENIADLTGLEAAYEAYKRFKMEKGSNDLKLPGLEEFTDEQLFLISFGTSHCWRKTQNFGKMRKGHSHSPANFRINGAVSNLNDFTKIFKCPIGSPMNPIDKCSLWKRTSSESGFLRMRWIKN